MPASTTPGTTTTSAVSTSVTLLAPLAGRVVPMDQVGDPTFADGIVGPGVAIEPPHERVRAVAPVSGTIAKLWPHAFVVVADDGTGVLVHLGLDTVRLQGEGFSTLVEQGDHVEVGQAVVDYDVAAVVAAGKDPVVPVVVMDKKARVEVLVEAGAELAGESELLTVSPGERG